MKNVIHISKLTLDVVSVDRLLDIDSSPFRGLGLNSQVAERILDKAGRCSRNWGYRIEVLVPLADMERGEEVRVAIHRHFEREHRAASRELIKIIRHGRVAAIFSLIFVAVLLSIGQMILRISDGFLALVASESMTVFSWVAMWRPAEIWLYKQWPVRSRRNLTQRLAKADIVLGKGTQA